MILDDQVALIELVQDWIGVDFVTIVLSITVTDEVIDKRAVSLVVVLRVLQLNVFWLQICFKDRISTFSWHHGLVKLVFTN